MKDFIKHKDKNKKDGVASYGGDSFSQSQAEVPLGSESNDSHKEDKPLGEEVNNVEKHTNEAEGSLGSESNDSHKEDKPLEEEVNNVEKNTNEAKGSLGSESNDSHKEDKPLGEEVNNVEKNTNEAEVTSLLEEKIKELEYRLCSAKEKELRNMADMENTRRRMYREQKRTIDRIKDQIIMPFLSFNDDLLRMSDVLSSDGVSKEFVIGVKLLMEKMENILTEHKIECINEVDIPFDVDRHDIISSQTDVKKKPDTVLRVVENGYFNKNNNSVIRFAKVIVSISSKEGAH